MQPGLDAIDMQILAQLQRDASVPVAEIAEAVGLSQSPCWRRIQRLEEQGYIRARVALLDRRKLGFSVEAIVQLRVPRDAATRAQFEQAVRALPEVTECIMLMGEEDFLLRVVATDLETYERFVRERLASVPGVSAVDARIAIAAVKSTHALPLEVLRKPPSTA
ncbi:MAG TPA: Lrp/AsnC family transcriptional regulator [Steroidobacteraceae bacterium]|nr:Lrp/AsnC family transcriptional regulator [Steroidobacteraceae bacterium]